MKKPSSAIHCPACSGYGIVSPPFPTRPAAVTLHPCPPLDRTFDTQTSKVHSPSAFPVLEVVGTAICALLTVGLLGAALAPIPWSKGSEMKGLEQLVTVTTNLWEACASDPFGRNCESWGSSSNHTLEVFQKNSEASLERIGVIVGCAGAITCLLGLLCSLACLKPKAIAGMGLAAAFAASIAVGMWVRIQTLLNDDVKMPVSQNFSYGFGLVCAAIGTSLVTVVLSRWVPHSSAYAAKGYKPVNMSTN